MTREELDGLAAKPPALLTLHEYAALIAQARRALDSERRGWIAALEWMQDRLDQKLTALEAEEAESDQSTTKDRP